MKKQFRPVKRKKKIPCLKRKKLNCYLRKEYKLLFKILLKAANFIIREVHEDFFLV
jgi:hypothetical protein